MSEYTDLPTDSSDDGDVDTTDFNDDGHYLARNTDFNDPLAHDPTSGRWNMTHEERRERLNHIISRYCSGGCTFFEYVGLTAQEWQTMRCQEEEEFYGELDIEDAYHAERAEGHDTHLDPEKPKEFTGKQKVRFGIKRRGSHEIHQYTSICRLYGARLRDIIPTIHRFEQRYSFTYQGPAQTQRRELETALRKIAQRKTYLGEIHTVQKLRALYGKIQNAVFSYRNVIAGERYAQYRSKLTSTVRQFDIKNPSIFFEEIRLLLTTFTAFLDKEKVNYGEDNLPYELFCMLRNTEDCIEGMMVLEKEFGKSIHNKNESTRIGRQKLQNQLVAGTRHDFGKRYRRLIQKEQKEIRELLEGRGGGDNFDTSPTIQTGGDINVYDRDGFYTLERSGLLAGLSFPEARKKKGK